MVEYHLMTYRMFSIRVVFSFSYPFLLLSNLWLSVKRMKIGDMGILFFVRFSQTNIKNHSGNISFSVFSRVEKLNN